MSNIEIDSAGEMLCRYRSVSWKSPIPLSISSLFILVKSLTYNRTLSTHHYQP